MDNSLSGWNQGIGWKPSHLEFKVPFQTYSYYWNRDPYGCRTEGSMTLLDVSYGLFLAHICCLHLLSYIFIYLQGCNDMSNLPDFTAITWRKQLPLKIKWVNAHPDNIFTLWPIGLEWLLYLKKSIIVWIHN